MRAGLWRVLVLSAALLASCGDDAEPAADTILLDGGDGAGDATDSAVDAPEGSDADVVDTGGGQVDTQDPACSAANASGFFPDCSACLDPGNCDSIDAPGASGRACGCGAGVDCPCGLRCGSYEIAPGISVSGICVR